MIASSTALVIAIVGVCGTLFAPIVSQTLSVRARREEFKLQSSQRQEEHEREHQKELLANKRGCYLLTMSTARRYRQELMNHLYAVNKGQALEASSEQLEEARLTFNASLAELQLTGVKIVLQALEPIRTRLSKSYESIKNLEEHRPKPGESFDELKESLLFLWVDEWPAMLEAMRIDLDVED
jgi:hypothetical protein